MNSKKYLLPFLAVFLFISFSIQSQEAPPYLMWHSFYITPDYTKLKEFKEVLSKHNKKFHGEGPHMTAVYHVMTGPNTGKIIWQMGPHTWTHLDSRPNDDGHNDDWQHNVMPYIKKIQNGEFWKQIDAPSNTSMLQNSQDTYPIFHLRFHEVARGKGDNVERLFQMIGDAVKAMDGVNPWGLYSNEFRQGYKIGRHLASVSFLKNWAEYEKNPFKEAFLKTHGDKSWDAFISGMESEFSDSWDEVWVYDAKLSGR